MLGKTTHMNIQSTLLPFSFQKIDDCLKFEGIFKTEEFKIQFLKLQDQETASLLPWVNASVWFLWLKIWRDHY